MYEMQGLSFREYLALFHGIDMPVASLDDIIGNRVPLPVEHPLPLFHDYLRRGYYPFGRDEEFDIVLMQVVSQTMETDIPQYLALNASMGYKLKSLLMVVAQSVPFKPVIQHIADATGLSRNNIPDYFLHMERAGMIAQLRDGTLGLRGLGKVEKLYLDNTNLIYALAPTDANIGNVRETFFMNQMRVKNEVKASRISDFAIGNRTFEIGDKKKGSKQIANAAEGYVVKDDIEYGFANVIPLWAFGMNY